MQDISDKKSCEEFDTRGWPR